MSKSAVIIFVSIGSKKALYVRSATTQCIIGYQEKNNFNVSNVGLGLPFVVAPYYRAANFHFGIGI